MNTSKVFRLSVILWLGLSTPSCFEGYKVTSDEAVNLLSENPLTPTPSIPTPAEDPDFKTLFESGATQVSGGRYHSCGIINDKVYCWGTGPNGEVGPLTTQKTPQLVLAKADDVKASLDFSCALSDKQVICWGSNGSSIMTHALPGTGSPSPVALFSPVEEMAPSGLHNCFKGAGGSLYCLGQNNCGQMAGGMEPDPIFEPPQTSLKQVLASGVAAVRSSSSASGTCIITTGGAVKCWGGSIWVLSNHGGCSPANPHMTQVPGLESGVDDVAFSSTYGCALKSGALSCWGNNQKGQLGLGNTTNQASAQPVPGMQSNVSFVVTNYDSTCAIQNNDLYCWGRDRRKYKLDELLPIITSPVKVASQVSYASINYEGICYITQGALKCSGTGGL